MKRRYAVCGLSWRAIHTWIPPIYKNHSNRAELVGVLDIDPLRFDICRKELPETENVPTYMPQIYLIDLHWFLTRYLFYKDFFV